jgi:carboxylesterase type B
MAQSNTESPVSVQIENLDIRGFIDQSTSVANYLGIPYASVPARFRQAVPVDPRQESGILEATSYGPSCPQPGDQPRGLRHHLFAGTGLSIPDGSPPSHVSDFSCLTLNIYTPAGTPSDARLPVVVWIHGGGWNLGDGNAEYGE